MTTGTQRRQGEKRNHALLVRLPLGLSHAEDPEEIIAALASQVVAWQEGTNGGRILILTSTEGLGP